jgi:hypothetical protein
MRRTLAEFGGRDALWPAERKLLDEVPSGKIVILDRVPLGNGTFEHQNQPVRASFIRYLATGGCSVGGPCEKGLRVRGAYIVGDNDAPGAETRGLDLEGCTLVGELLLSACIFPDRVIMRFVEANSITFDKSRFEKGLTLRGARIKENINLRAVECLDEVSLSHAQVGGDLVLDGAYLEAGEYSRIDTALEPGSDRRSGKGGSDQFALVAQNITVGGGYLFREEVRYNKAREAKIIKAPKGAGVHGGVDLRAGNFGFLSDSREAWPTEHPLLLNRSEYRAILGGAPTDVESRLEWLAYKQKSTADHPFWPQPYEQLASVYRKMGYRSDAKEILVEKEKLQRAERRADAGFRRLWLLPRDYFLHLFTGYGYRPHRSLAALLFFWVVGTGVFSLASHLDAIKPNNAFILRSPEWAACSSDYTKADQNAAQIRRDETAHGSQLECFADQPEALSYPRFTAWLYALDTLLPVVEMEMQEYWLPDETHSAPDAAAKGSLFIRLLPEPVVTEFGKYARWYLWVHIAAGWLFSLFAVAGFSGLIKSD